MTTSVENPTFFSLTKAGRNGFEGTRLASHEPDTIDAQRRRSSFECCGGHIDDAHPRGGEGLRFAFQASSRCIFSFMSKKGNSVLKFPLSRTHLFSKPGIQVSCTHSPSFLYSPSLLLGAHRSISPPTPFPDPYPNLDGLRSTTRSTLHNSTFLSTVC